MYNTAKYMPLKQGAISNFVVPCVNLEKLGNHSNQIWSRKKKYSKTLAICNDSKYLLQLQSTTGPPAFPNGGRGQTIFCRFNFAIPIILQHLEKVVSMPDADLKLNEG